MDTNGTKKASFGKRDFLIGICVGTLLGVVVFFTLNAITNTCNHPGQKLSDQTRPHSPYLIMRDTIDDGFSRGWMPHFLVSEDNWINVHIHLSGVANEEDLKRALNEYYSKLGAYRLGKVIILTSQDNLFGIFHELSQKDPRFGWMYWPRIGAPSVSKVREAVEHGACGIKLHNSPIMSGRVPRDIYMNDEWQAIFAYAESEGIPLLWHVTQRLSYSQYHVGGLNSYWSDGWKRGVNFNNEDLLQDVLQLMRSFPKLKVIGAHQLHVGTDRLNELFKAYENLYIDSSCGMILRYSDEFIEEDRLLLRDFVETWSERITFGTDGNLSPNSNYSNDIELFTRHTRFMLKLGLSDKALQDVAWRTAQHLLNLKPDER